MKKIILTLLVALGIAGQAVAQVEYDENNEPTSGWLVVGDNVSIETSDQGNGEFSSLSEMYWQRSKFFLAKGSLLEGGAEYITIWSEDGEYREPKYPDGYIYFQGEMDGEICERIKKDGLKKVQLSSYIPVVYGNGKTHKAENGMSFKIVPFKSSAKVKIENSMDGKFKRFLKSQKCYLLMIMSSTGKVEHVELLEKTSKGFKNAHHEYQQFSQKEPKVNAQGLLTTQWTMFFSEEEAFFLTHWTWVKDENALVGVSEVEPMSGQYIIPFLKVAK